MTVRYAFLIQRVQTLGDLGNERGGKKEAVFLFNKKRVTQGCPLAMVEYGLLILPLVRKLTERVQRR